MVRTAVISLTAFAALVAAKACYASDESDILDGVSKRNNILTNHQWSWKLTRSGVVGSGHIPVPGKVDSGQKRPDSMVSTYVDQYNYNFNSFLNAVQFGDLLRVEFESCSLDPGNKQVKGIPQVEYFGPGYLANGSFSTGVNRRTGKKLLALDQYNIVSVTGETWQNTSAQYSAMLPTVDFRPELALFLVGANPLRLYGLTPNSITSDVSGYTVEYHYDASRRIPGTTVAVPRDITVHLAKDGRPVALESLSSKRPFLSIKTSGFSHSTFPLNTKVEIEYRPTGSKDVAHIVYDFEKMEKSDAEELFEKGTRAIDWRLLQGDMVATEYPPRGNPKTYKVENRFKTLDELKGASDMKWDITANTDSGQDSSRPKIMMASGAAILLLGTIITVSKKRKKS